MSKKGTLKCNEINKKISLKRLLVDLIVSKGGALVITNSLQSAIIHSSFQIPQYQDKICHWSQKVSSVTSKRPLVYNV